jgi:hypothetical protein
MPDPKPKQPGHDSGVAANQIVQNRALDRVPGKSTRDDGADPNNFNFLAPEDRAELELNYKLRCVNAGNHCNTGIEAAKVHTLMKKSEDMHWVFGAILELASIGITQWAVKAISMFKAGKIAGYASQSHDATMGGRYDVADKADARKAMFQAITDESIKARIGFIGGLAKSQARPVMAAALADSSEKAADLSLLGQLQKSLDVAFQSLSERGLKGASDAEALVLFQAMDIAHHSSETYERAVVDWMKRFKASGVDRIGSAQYMVEGGIKREVTGFENRERRVVWVADEQGKKSLWFRENTSTMGGQASAAHLTGLVPREFWEEATSLHEQNWGVQPETLMDSPETRAARGVSPGYADRINAARVKRTAQTSDDGSAAAARVVKIFGGQ